MSTVIAAGADAADFCEVAVALPVHGFYTYRVPPALTARVVAGARVTVPFRGRGVPGVVVRTAAPAPDGAIHPSPVTEVHGERVPAELLALALWIADYYEAPPGEALRLVVPAGTADSSAPMIALTDAGRAAVDGAGAALPPAEARLLARIAGARGEIKRADVPRKELLAALPALLRDGLVVEGAAVKRARVRARRERHVALAPALDLAAALAALARAPTRRTTLALLAERLGPPADGAPDTSAADASATDASATDASATDASATDAGATDAGATDAGATDASATDAGATDAGATDAGATDAGATDASAPGAVAAARASRFLPLSALGLAPAQRAAIKELEAAGYVRTEEREVAPEVSEAGAGMAGGASATPPELTAEQRVAVDAIAGAIGQGFGTFLVHGVTGSGKTEVYLRVIAQARARGLGAIVLVPEISLTPQLAARFRARFGDEVAILHSGLRDAERFGEWQRLVRGSARIAVGARSAVFAPVADVGVIVVDEEHDGSFKQDEGVRYHGRDVAMVRAQRAGAVCLLGSATPSLESYAAAQAGRYRLLSMPTRATGAAMPPVELVDLRRYQPDGEGMLSAPLARAIDETLAAGDQTILFLNRRGFATFVLCRACGHAFRCRDCAVSMTYHRAADRLVCHYCDFAMRVPEACPACKTVGAIERKGLGTERVAAALAERWPAARVARLDRDVATGAKAEAVLARVARREVDILVGTQMVTKGHDFPGVTLVGVLCADLALSLPDFRAAERTFQLLTQVAGRAGRAERPGRVIIQTYRTEADAITCAARHDYAAFFAAEDAARAELGYPPHGRLAAIRIDGPDLVQVAAAARELGAAAVATARTVGDQVQVLGPAEAPLARLRGRSRWQLWLKGRDRAALRRVVRSVLSVEVKGVRVAADVDPLSAL